MTTNPQLAYAIVGKDGKIIATMWTEPKHVAASETITPVLLIPRDDAVKWAAMVLLENIDTPHDDDDYAASEMADYIRVQDRPLFRAALRALAGQEGGA